MAAPASRWTWRSSDFCRGEGVGKRSALFNTTAANIGAGSLPWELPGWDMSVTLAWGWAGSAGLGSLLLAFTVGPRLWACLQRTISIPWAITWNFVMIGASGSHCRPSLDGALAILAGQLIALPDPRSGCPPPNGSDVPRGLWLPCTLRWEGSSPLPGSTRLFSSQSCGVSLGRYFAFQVSASSSHLYGSPSYFQIANIPDRTELQRRRAYRHPRLCDSIGSSFIVSWACCRRLRREKPSVVRPRVSLNALGLLTFAIAPPILGMLTRQVYPT